MKFTLCAANNFYFYFYSIVRADRELCCTH